MGHQYHPARARCEDCEFERRFEDPHPNGRPPYQRANAAAGGHKTGENADHTVHTKLLMGE